jgi:SAM-dependent methyltransferase
MSAFEPVMSLPMVHLCIVQPVGYLHSLGFLDQARFFRHQFRRLGAQVTLAKNRLRHGAVNFVFGAHLGFDAELKKRYTCIFVNLEQLGYGGNPVAPEYLKLLSSSAVVDYDAGNVSAYTPHAGDVPLVSFAHAPYLKGAGAPELDQRPIGLLFFGSLNDRRTRLLSNIEASGHKPVVALGLYGPERDDLIRQARAVLNCHFYDSARFEQARVFQCLSLGTPVVSERLEGTSPPPQFEDSVFWVRPEGVRDFFASRFDTAPFFAEARQKLHNFRAHDVAGQYANALAFAVGFRQVHSRQIDRAPWRPTHLNFGSGKDYKPGWLNIDILEKAQPDVVLDLARPHSFPLRIDSEMAGSIELQPGSVRVIYANNVLEHVPDLVQLMTNCLTLLAPGGEMLIEVPYERAPAAWQDPTHVRAMNENSWIYYSDWFWYLGWFEWRLQVGQFVYLDAKLKECAREAACFMRVALTKVATTLAEKMTARTMQPNFGGVPDDLEQRPIRDIPLPEPRIHLPSVTLPRTGESELILEEPGA